eukprot:3237909-Prymnesium_polylepis.1
MRICAVNFCATQCSGWIARGCSVDASIGVQTYRHQPGESRPYVGRGHQLACQSTGLVRSGARSKACHLAAFVRGKSETRRLLQSNAV